MQMERGSYLYTISFAVTATLNRVRLNLLTLLKGPLEPVNPVNPIENSSLVSFTFSVSGTYIAGFDTEKQSNVLIFETEKYTRNAIGHENPYNEINVCSQDVGYSCPISKVYPAFTADLDWRIFDEAPLSKIFSSPLFDTERGTPAVYTWDMVTSEGTPEGVLDRKRLGSKRGSLRTTRSLYDSTLFSGARGHRLEAD